MIDFSITRSGVWTKLCGVRDAATAAALAELRPDAIGLNFYEPSPRFITEEAAAEVVRSLPEEIAAIGVFVNSSADEILSTIESVGLKAVQLHGDEPPELIAELKRRRGGLVVLRAWRVSAEGLELLAEHLAACRRIGALPDAILVDAKVPGEYGGTGTTAPWHALKGYDPAWPPLILAGGLTPENVAAAIATVRPFGVDTAGGIESAPGVKDPARADAFLKAVRGEESRNL